MPIKGSEHVRPKSTAEAAKRHSERALRVIRDIGRGTMTITLEVPFEQGELVCRAIDKATQERVDEVSDPRTGWLARQADALVDIAQAYLAGGSVSSTSSADRYQVVIHVDATALKDGEGLSDLPVESVRASAGRMGVRSRSAAIGRR